MSISSLHALPTCIRPHRPFRARSLRALASRTGCSTNVPSTGDTISNSNLGLHPCCAVGPTPYGVWTVSQRSFQAHTVFVYHFADFVDSSKLDLHPFLCYNKSRPMTTYDLRREPLTLMFREIDRPLLASDMDHSVTRPPTQYMRLYHSRLPWYIDIRANGAPYISLADFFQQLFAALNKPITKYDFYNNELDDEDRQVLTRTYFERCCHEDEKMEGVKRVDFLRGKKGWLGLIAGKNGMWRLRTG